MPLRELRFAKLSDIKNDLDQLASQGFKKSGSWDLSQMSNHLADWMGFPIDGFPKPPWFVGLFLGLMRITQGKALYRKFVKEQRMPTSQPTVPTTVYPPNDSHDAAVKRLHQAIDRLSTYRGPIYPSPLFGQLSYDETVALQLAHCAHHLRFLEPKT
jgi:hypothetical protein